MLTKITSANHPTTVVAIERFEREAGLALPPAYKDLLLETNGGVPDKPLFPIEGMALNPYGVVQAFFGIDAKWETSDLARVHALYAGGVPAGILPIAGNGTGDYLCLDLRDGKERVVLWDKRHYWGTGEWCEDDLFHVAGTFEEFLASFRPEQV